MPSAPRHLTRQCSNPRVEELESISLVDLASAHPFRSRFSVQSILRAWLWAPKCAVNCHRYLKFLAFLAAWAGGSIPRPISYFALTGRLVSSGTTFLRWLRGLLWARWASWRWRAGKSMWHSTQLRRQQGSADYGLPPTRRSLGCSQCGASASDWPTGSHPVSPVECTARAARLTYAVALSGQTHGATRATRNIRMCLVPSRTPCSFMHAMSGKHKPAQ